MTRKTFYTTVSIRGNNTAWLYIPKGMQRRLELKSRERIKVTLTKVEGVI